MERAGEFKVCRRKISGIGGGGSLTCIERPVFELGLHIARIHAAVLYFGDHLRMGADRAN